MPEYSRASSERLATCHTDLITIFTQVIYVRDCTIIEGHRSKARQNEMCRTGMSQIMWPDGKHNSIPSEAVDVMEYFPDRPHLHWSDLDAIEDFSHFVLATAETLRAQGVIAHGLRWGADWDMDGVRGDKDPDESFFDGPHYELFKGEAS